jgi:hypothetical protein
MKKFAVGAVVTVTTCLAFMTFAYVTIQGFNKPAAIVATVIAIIGILWLKRTSKSYVN